METIERAIEVERPADAVYRQWLRFEDYPRFMQGVKNVTEDDLLIRWEVEVGGQLKHWNATLTEQIPDQRIAWESEAGEYIVAVVSMKPLASGRTRVVASFLYDPKKSRLDSDPDARSALAARIEGDLVRFKALMESDEAPRSSPANS